MSGRTGSRDTFGSKRTTPWIALVVMLALALVGWWNWPARITLSQSDYDIAIALYRACNQRSDDGIAKVEQHLEQLATANPASEPPHHVLSGIISAAKSGQWQSAAVACRKILDDQVRR